jgi:hypothetical protein
MRTFKGKQGPFQERPYYTANEIETICLDELVTAGLLPSSPEAIRIERFIEKRFLLTPVYEELPAEVLGYTLFGTKGPTKIVISRTLANEGTKPAERRINTTLAHEAGHCLLHGHLFAMASPPTHLFGSDATRDKTSSKILCRDGEREARYDGKWWEYQANQAIGALLLPRKLVQKLAEPFFNGSQSFLPKLSASGRAAAVRGVAEAFDVNRIVAEIRVSELFPATDQLSL